MTLFEAMVALVILGLSAIGVLEALQVNSRSTREAVVWTQAVGYAESAMEETKLGAPPSMDSLATGFSRRVTSTAWPGVPGVQRVTVTVTLPRGGTFVLERLVKSP
jgi:Tfp pilus assembly protein PilV